MIKIKHKRIDNLGIYAKGLKGKKHPMWKGGRRIVDGYMYIYKPNHPFATKQRYVCEHRLIMEKMLGRYLTKKEIVHHIDNDKLNNTEENLKLLKDLDKHNIIHNKIRDKLGRFKGVDNQND